MSSITPQEEKSDFSTSSKKKKIIQGIQSLDLRSRSQTLQITIGKLLPIPSVFFTWFKLFILTPMMGYILWSDYGTQTTASPSSFLSSSLILWGFVLFLLCDFLKKSRSLAIYSQNQSENHYTYNQSIDRVSDFPLTLIAAYTASSYLNPWILWSKIALDACTLLLSTLGRGPERTKLRSTLSETLLFALLCLSVGWAGKLITISSVSILLGIHIAFNTLVLTSQLGLLQKRFIADTLSFSNLLCGCASMYTAQQHNFDASLLYLLLGATFDGFDGAAARKFGGTAWGVYSDDIADGVNYGLAPGFALYILLGGNEGLIIGVFYAIFTISRLVFFTLNKEAVDPNYFSGIPSPVGGMIVMSAIVLFVNQTTWVCFLVGIACTQMVSFSTYYRHLGRAMSHDRKALFGAPAGLLFFIFSAGFWGVKGAAVVILSGALLYGFLPSMLSFIYVIKAFFQLRTQKDITDQ
jgi:CDP-diacylglycerol---serine O-phosphatidyltransferase